MQNYQEMMKSTFDNITQIGTGGGGTVFKAYHKRLGIDVVLKKIHTNKLKSIDHRAELDILKKLKSEYIPQIYDFIEYGDDVFTVMEYIPGESFAQLLEQKKKFSQKDVAKWMLQLCKVLAYLHSQKPAIIHCDIKPANVMLTPKGDICLIDFNISGIKTEEGIASIGYSNAYSPVEQFAVVARYLEQKPVALKVEKAVVHTSDFDKTEIEEDYESDKTEIEEDYEPDKTEIEEDYEPDNTEITEATVCQSTPVTAAQNIPERSRMRALSDEEWKAAKNAAASVGKNLRIDEKTDIYSMGATMYHILTGVRPQPFYQKQVSVQNINPNISESLAYIIDKAMEINPEKRFKDSAQLLKTVRNMGTVDKRYKALVRRQWMMFLMFLVLVVSSAGMVVLGKTTMTEERTEQYQEYVEAIQDAGEALDYEAAEANYQAATALFPAKQEAYYQMAMAYYTTREYEQCIVFLNEEVYTNMAVSQDSSYDKFYYITASCYFEREDYESAIDYYEMALNLQENEVTYYRDYVIALARNGQVDAAEQELQVAVEKGISGDIISLLRGEILLIKGNYIDAESYLKDCITATAEDYTRLRAYTKLDEVYEKLYEGAEQYTTRITHLKEALSVLPTQYQVTLLERLAQAYIDFSDVQDKKANCQNAIAVFEQMETMGYATFTSRYNIAVLYEKMGSYSSAMAQLESMLETYANNYNIYKRMAFVELNIQAEKANSDRNYYTFENYYTTAMKLYQENAGADDVEMLSLQQLYNDVVANGWL